VIFLEGDFTGIIAELHRRLLNEAPQVDTGHWQSLKNVPHTATRELFRVSLETIIPPTMDEAQEWIEPNLPWAEDHFQERVAGKPTNPGEHYMNWPWYRGGVEDHKSTGAFSHSYQERMWPQFANEGQVRPNGRQVFVPHNGIRYRYGDLEDLVSLLHREPTTRQAFLPIWFPEDTGAHHGERIPCTLGYLFNLRGGVLHCTYYIRSCDFLRYLRDDVYMAMRLTQWIVDSLTCSDIPEDQPPHEKKPYAWDGVIPGLLQMNIGSLHVFEGDMGKMRREAP